MERKPVCVELYISWYFPFKVLILLVVKCSCHSSFSFACMHWTPCLHSELYLSLHFHLYFFIIKATVKPAQTTTSIRRPMLSSLVKGYFPSSVNFPSSACAYFTLLHKTEKCVTERKDRIFEVYLLTGEANSWFPQIESLTMTCARSYV